MPNSVMDHDDYKVLEFNGVPVNLYVQRMMSKYPGLASHIQFKNYAMASVNEMVMQLTGWLASGTIPTRTETVSVSWPDGVWQTFKDRYMPHWFVRWFPVREQHKTIETSTHHYFVCPHVDVPTTGGDHLVHIKFMATGTPLAERMINAHL